MRAVWPLTGRESELSAVLRAIGSVRDEPGGLVLAGPAGVGKTRLAREAVDHAARQGRDVRWATGTASAHGVPLGAFAELMEQGTPADTIRQAARGLAAADRGGILVVDDAHLLDDASASLVHQLALRRTTSLVVTVRTGAPPPDAVTALWKDEHLVRLDVGPLTRQQTAALLDRVLDGRVPAATVDALWELTRGNVLFLRQLVQDERRAGRLRLGVDGWTWPGHPMLTRRLTELVDAEMGRLDPPAVEAMDLLTLGEPLPLVVLRRLSDGTVLERLERQGLIRVDRSDLQVRVAHPLYAEACRARMGTLTARRLRGRLVGELPLRDLSGSALLRGALLALESDLPPDPELLTRAALAANRLVDLDVSERLARAAAEADGGFVPRLTWAMVVGYRSRGEEAEAALVALASEVTTEAEQLTVAVCRGATQLWTVGDPVAAQLVVDEAASRLGTAAGPHLAAIESAVVASQARSRRAVELARRALAGGDLAPPTAMAAAYGLVGSLAVLGEVLELDRAAASAYRVAETCPEVSFLQFGLAHLHVTGLLLAGEIDRLDAVVEGRRREAGYLPGQAQDYCLGLVGLAAMARGRLTPALTSLDRALQSLGSVEGTGFRYIALLHRTQTLAQLGLASRARADADLLVAAPHPAFRFLAPGVELALAWVAAAESSQERAVDGCRVAADLARELDEPAYEVMALQSAVGFGDHGGTARLQTLAERLPTPRAALAVRHALGWDSHDGDALLAVAERYAAMGDGVAAANAAAQAVLGYRREGRRGAATLAAARASVLRDRCDGVVTPALTQVLRPLPLTGRQREIATLVGEGLTNQQIASRLVLSVRTVEGHVYRACSLLGVTDRADLAHAVHGPVHGPVHGAVTGTDR